MLPTLQYVSIENIKPVTTSVRISSPGVVVGHTNRGRKRQPLSKWQKSRFQKKNKNKTLA